MDNDIGAVSCNMIAAQPLGVLASARAAGLACIEWFACRPTDILEPAQAAEIAAISSSLGIRNTYHAPYKDGWNVAEQSSVQQTTSIISEMLRQASRLQADLMTLHLGELPANADHQAAMRQAARGVGHAATLAADLGVRISVENMPIVPGKSYLGDNPEDFDMLFEVADSASVGLNMDFGHAHVARNMNEMLARHGHRLTNTHLHDNDGSADQHQPVGQGTIDWTAALRWMVRLGYQGPFNIEFAESKGGYGSTVALIRGFTG